MSEQNGADLNEPEDAPEEEAEEALEEETRGEEVEEEGEERDVEAVAAAAVAASYAASLENNVLDADNGTTNKWSNNGYGVPVDRHTGKFNKEESELVRNAIEEYCNAKQISVSRLCSECDHKAELKGAWMEIAKRLPHRSVQSVYRHGIRQCHPFKRGSWSEQECTTLQDLVTRMGKKWSAIQAKLNRSADSCRDKYREMSDEFVKGRWKEEESDTLKRLIREHVNTQTGGATSAIEDMKELGKLVEEGNIQIPWSIISKRMAKRSRLSCFKKWQKMTGLFSPADDSKKQQRVDKPARGEPVAKRIKTETPVAEEGGDTTAAAELAAETVEALELPDTDALATSKTEKV